MQHLERSRIEEMGREECVRLLRTTSSVGRVGFLSDGEPVVLPVNYFATTDAVVFCTAPGTLLANLGSGMPVAFEVDAGSTFYETGWSVLVRGTAREVTDAEEIAQLRHGPHRSWAAPEPERWIRLSIDQITGRRILLAGTMESSP